MEQAISLVEKGILPDCVVKWGIRRLLAERLRLEDKGSMEANLRALHRFIGELKQSPVAIATDKANEQHYELPPGFFLEVLGPRLKYSSCYWEDDTPGLKVAEDLMLDLTCARARIDDGMDILELGCGWGSLTLWMAETYPNAKITAVSNSAPQREFIMGQCEKHGLKNIEVITADMNDFSIDRQFDRVVSVEMFEHMRNYRELYARVARWLKPGGKFFKHIFVHRDSPYLFEDRGPGDWMSRFFFSGGMMPSDDLPLFFQEQLCIEKRWRWDGRHYEKTANAWLEKMDASRETLWPLFEQTYGKDFAATWWQRWRIFFMACAELFGYNDGQEWWVSHYLFHKR